jgi:hypothetical protein
MLGLLGVMRPLLPRLSLGRSSQADLDILGQSFLRAPLELSPVLSRDFPYRGALVMSTYATGQYLLVSGVGSPDRAT